MANNYFKTYNKEEKTSNLYYIFLLYLSFLWAGFYVASNTIVDGLVLGYGKLFSFNSGNFIYNILFILMFAGLELTGFEILFWFYRLFLSYKVYTFIVPANKFKVDCRVFFAIRNVIVGIFANLCFLYPFIYAYLELIEIVSVLVGVIIYSYYTQKTYSEPLVAHFVFKNFCTPIFAYEIIMAFSYFFGGL